MLQDTKPTSGRPSAATFGEEPGVERTLNGTGYMISSLDEISEAFVDHATAEIPWPALDIGAAFGVATHAALREGVQVVANDIDAAHLDILEDRTPLDLRPRLSMVPGSFPEGFDFAPETFSAVLLSRVMHFFDGSQVERSVAKLFDWLIPGGKAFVVVEASIFMNHPPLRERYESQRVAGARWPGFVNNVKSLLPRRAKFVPDQLHYLDTEVLRRSFREGGFTIETAHHFHRQVDPQDPAAGVRESVGLIARKP